MPKRSFAVEIKLEHVMGFESRCHRSGPDAFAFMHSGQLLTNTAPPRSNLNPTNTCLDALVASSVNKCSTGLEKNQASPDMASKAQAMKPHLQTTETRPCDIDSTPAHAGVEVDVQCCLLKITAQRRQLELIQLQVQHLHIHLTRGLVHLPKKNGQCGFIPVALHICV